MSVRLPRALRRDSSSQEQPRGSLREAIVALDSDPRLLTAAEWARRRLPGDDRLGDPLSTASDAPVALLHRRVSALHRDRDSFAHEIALGAAQLWQALSEKQGRGHGTREVCLLFTDLVGFSTWVLGAGDEAAVRLLRDVGALLEPLIARHDGVIVKRLGDGLMAAFEDSQKAVEAALEAHHELGEVSVDGYQPQIRAGLHTGRPRKLGGDYVGIDVNIAARVGEHAGAGEVLVSQTLGEGLDRTRFSLSAGAILNAAGVPGALSVYRVRLAEPP